MPRGLTLLIEIWRKVQATTLLGLAAKAALFDRVAGFCGLITTILFSFAMAGRDHT